MTTGIPKGHKPYRLAPSSVLPPNRLANPHAAVLGWHDKEDQHHG